MPVYHSKIVTINVFIDLDKVIIYNKANLGGLIMGFRKKLYYVALTEFLLNKKNEIVINENISLTINVRRGNYCQSPSSWLDIPSLDFFVTILNQGNPIYKTFYQKIAEPDLDTLLKSSPEVINEFIQRDDLFFHEYVTYSYLDSSLIQYEGTYIQLLQDDLSFKNPSKLVRTNIKHKYNKIMSSKTK